MPPSRKPQLDDDDPIIQPVRERFLIPIETPMPPSRFIELFPFGVGVEWPQFKSQKIKLVAWMTKEGPTDTGDESRRTVATCTDPETAVAIAAAINQSVDAIIGDD